MKSVAFFRSWKKRGKDKNATEKGKQDVSTTNRVVLVPESAPCTPMAISFGIPATTTLSPPPPDHRVRSQSQNAIIFDPSSVYSQKRNDPRSSASSISSFVDQEIVIPSSTSPKLHEVSYSPHNPVAWKASHGPPKNTSHGPPNLKIYSPISGASPRSTGGTPPVRPPRPPPLNLYPTSRRRPMNTGIPPRFMADRTITFALPPNPRDIKSVGPTSTTSGSSSDSPTLSEDHKKCTSKSLEKTIHCNCAIVLPDGNHSCPHRSALCDGQAVVNLPRASKLDSRTPASPPRTAQTVEFSDPPASHRVYQRVQQTSSTPHLPSQDKQEELPPLPPLPFNPLNGQADDVSNFPLSLFPPPPRSPLFIRRKIAKHFVLRPSPTSSGAPLPASPSLSSPEYTPLVTPTTPRFQPSPNHSKSCSSLSRHLLPRVIPRPLFDPPSTPLPTPPTSPVYPTATGASSPSLSSKSLRTVQSANHLCSEEPRLHVMQPTRRATSPSTPSPPYDATYTNLARRRAQSRPDAAHRMNTVV